ncbi:MAG: phage holin family protein [Chitinivibrionales bacterium]|nr:phage holin family protein [Chitinivibrionales bacterium]
METILKILLLALAVFAVAKLLPAIHVKSFGVALLVAVVYSVINFLLGWLLFILALPLIIITFGLFKLIINAFLLWITDKLIPGFEIKGFGWTIIAALLITLADSALRWMIL